MAAEYAAAGSKQYISDVWFWGGLMVKETSPFASVALRAGRGSRCTTTAEFATSPAPRLRPAAVERAREDYDEELVKSVADDRHVLETVRGWGRENAMRELASQYRLPEKEVIAVAANVASLPNDGYGSELGHNAYEVAVCGP